MGNYTPNLNLYNTDMTTDGNDLFDFDRDLNQNNTKIDTAVGKLADLTTTYKTNIVGAVNEVKNNAQKLNALDDDGKKVIDGQWVYHKTCISTADINPNTTQTFDLSSSLPVDNFNYEILLDIRGTVPESKISYIYFTTDVITGNTSLIRTRSFSSTLNAPVCVILTVPIGTNRSLSLMSTSSSTGVLSGVAVYLSAYRRLGTNS